MKPSVWILVGTLLLATSGGAQELSRFSCQRPEPVETGSATNAGIASMLVDGKVLKPGELFSFNRSMAPGLARFVEGTAYSSGKVIKSEGGGICQVSAALYNAALLAGLEVEERSSHSIYDPMTAYVPAGRDCAISRSNHADLRFRNSTAAPLTLGVKAEGGRVDVVLYGHQRNPKRRWIITRELERSAHRMNVRRDENLSPGTRRIMQKGFDGLRVRRQLCRVGPEGITVCASLGVDSYMLVNEIWNEGPSEAAP